MRKSEQFYRMLKKKETSYIMEAHNALSGKIVENAGFKGIWGSGLSISASLGLRDNNEASWTDVMQVVEFMSDATQVPILLDADTGYGNFNNARMLVKKLEKLNVAAVCIEDKAFPKTNSFINGEKQKLADVDEFCGKIKAMKDTQTDPFFSVVARTEAFITGMGTNEALRRAHAYKDAGADAIFVHSKMDTACEIIDFMNNWDSECPVIIAPTTYINTDPEVFKNCGVRIVIWANFMLRASIYQMQNVAKKIYEKRSAAFLENEIVPLMDVFELQNVAELQEAEKKYLPCK